MNPKIWGPHAWIFLHSITMAYPDCPKEDEKQSIKNFFYNLRSVLPCDKCKINYDNHLAEYPLSNEILNSKSKLINWLIDIHNSVNKLNNKKNMSYDDMMKLYEEIYSVNNKKKFNLKTNIYEILCLLFVIIIVTLLLYVAKRMNL